MGALVVFDQQRRRGSPAARRLDVFAAAARAFGATVHGVPETFHQCSATDALFRLSAWDAVGFLNGYIQPAGYYEELAAAAETSGVRMLNTPKQSMTLMEGDRWVPRLGRLTALSVIVRTDADCHKAFDVINGPVFVKGAVKSRKEDGLAACLAHSPADLLAHLEMARRMPVGGRGIVIARQLLPLRQNADLINSFPVSREYRAYTVDHEPIGLGFYWPLADPFGQLTRAERTDVEDLVSEASRALGARVAAIDVGQLSDGTWTVIEPGDPQYSGIAHMPHQAFLTHLADA